MQKSDRNRRANNNPAYEKPRAKPDKSVVYTERPRVVKYDEGGLPVVPTSTRITKPRTAVDAPCPFCMYPHAEFLLTVQDVPTLFCPRCKTRVFCNSANSEIVVRAVCRAHKEVDGLAAQLTVVYAQFMAALPAE